MEYQKDILIIDDEEDLTQMLQKGFESKGYNTFVACDGVAGLKILKDIKPNLIILDINMPRMGGFEFYKNICDDESQPKFPVFVLTGRGEVENFFRNMNVSGFMAKPFRFNQLFYKIETILESDY